MTNYENVEIQLEKYNVCSCCNLMSPENCNSCNLQSVHRYLRECGTCIIRQATDEEIQEIMKKVGKCKN